MIAVTLWMITSHQLLENDYLNVINTKFEAEESQHYWYSLQSYTHNTPAIYLLIFFFILLGMILLEETLHNLL